MRCSGSGPRTNPMPVKLIRDKKLANNFKVLRQPLLFWLFGLVAYSIVALVSLTTSSKKFNANSIEYIQFKDDDDDDNPTPTLVNLKEKRPTIFYCTKNDQNGFGETKAIFKSVLPDYDWVPVMFNKGWEPSKFRDQMPREGRNNKWDFFVMPLVESCNGMVLKWVLDDFQGNIVYTSGENWGERIVKMDHKFVIGPVAESDRTMTLTYMQMVWYHKFRPRYLVENQSDNAKDGALPAPEALLAEPTKRPRGKPYSEKEFLIYAASNCVGFREQAFLDLSSIGNAHYGGKCKGPNTKDWTNRTKAENGVSLRNWWENVNFYSNYRFCLVMEHGREEPYLTEKILMAFLGGCVPVYYGSKKVLDIFHPSAFVYYDVENPSQALDRIRTLETNPKAYEEILNFPILSNGKQTVAEYFSFSDNIGGGKLKERIRKKLRLDLYDFVKQTSTNQTR
mmetsp:Transcript_69242/g.77466  ORF Transcript_69242/g.77466 Transcript_69242/m.77466 type:complete len:451 (-) Transcript_69242:158-1510(-)